MKLIFWIEPHDLGNLADSIYNSNTYNGNQIGLYRQNHSGTFQQVQIDYNIYIDLLENKNIILIHD